MGYGGPPADAKEFPWKDEEAQYEYGRKTADDIWDRMLERATIGSKCWCGVSEENPEGWYRLPPEGNLLYNIIRHLTFCEYWDEYRSEEYLRGISERLEERIRARDYERD
jgi:hypothetical protein